MKMKEFGRGARVPGAPLRSANAVSNEKEGHSQMTTDKCP